MSDVTRTVRWSLKKIGRQSVALAAWTSGWLRLRNWLGRRPRVRVITYHRFGEASRDPFCIRVNDFERQMAWLARRGRAVSLADVQAFLAGRKDLPDGSVLVTIDDGCPSLYSRALPILQRYHIPAVAFVPAGELVTSSADDPHRNDDDHPNARLTWAELKAIAAASIVVGSHAWTHRSLCGLSVDEIRDQVERSRNVLEARTGQSVTSFAYPFGTRADFNAATTAALQQCGYSCAFTSQHGAIIPGRNPFTLPRIKIEAGEPAWMFDLACAGALDAWGLIDRVMWRWQQR